MKVIKNGRIFYKNRLVDADIGIEGGKIQKIKKTGLKGKEIDARGNIVLPAGIDIHVHFRDFKESYKEDWSTGSKAAAAGGITTVFDHPNTNPPVKNKEMLKKKLKRAKKKSFVDFGLNAAGTKDSDLEGMAKNGASAFGEIFFTEKNQLGLPEKDTKEVLDKIKELNKKPLIHAEDSEVIKKAQKRFKDKDPIYYPDSRPKKAEIQAIKKLLNLTKKSNQKLHFCHITTVKGAQMISDSIHTSEITPHHLFFRKQKLEHLKGYIKTNPPIRDTKNRNYLWKLFKNNKINILASDHAPHTIDEKEKDFWEAPSGVPGVQTMFPLMAYQVKRNNLNLNKLVWSISKNPSRLFDLNKGSIEEGNYADLVIMDFNDISEIKPKKLYSKCNWTPFEGKNAIFPQKTILKGKIIWKDGEFPNQEGEMVGMG